MSKGTVYVIGGRYQKIGFTRGSARSRLEAIRTGSPYPLSVALEIECERPERAEKKAHAALSAKRLSGEWFDVSVEEAMAVVRQVVSEVEAEPPPTVVQLSSAPDENYKQQARDAQATAWLFLELLQKIEWDIAWHQRFNPEKVLAYDHECELQRILRVNGLEVRSCEPEVSPPDLGEVKVFFDDGWSPIRETKAG